MRDNGTIASAVSDLSREVEQFKGVQFSGADIYTNHTQTLSGSYDFTVGSMEQTGALFKFIGEKQALPYAMAYVRYYSNPGLTAPVDPRTLDGGVYLDVAGSSGKTLRWEFLVFNKNAFTVYGKVYALTTDAGVLSYDY